MRMPLPYLQLFTLTAMNSSSAAEVRLMTPVSLHSYFLLRGRPNVDIIYSVRKMSDLRSFSTRSVDAIQHGTPIFTMQAQFQRTGQSAGLQHALQIPVDIPPPESCVSMHDVLTDLLLVAPAPLQPLIKKQVLHTQSESPCARSYMICIDTRLSGPLRG